MSRLRSVVDERRATSSTFAPPGGSDQLSRRIPVLDGIRGVAILLVLYTHLVAYAQFEDSLRLDHWVELSAAAGWIGVDVFFVLSGFLITGILFDSKGSGRYLIPFYGRRTLRIFPLYFGYLAVSALAAPLVLGRPLFGVGDASPLWFLTYTSNFDVALHGWREPLALGHLWSLAVEEQFYLLWPLVVFVFDRRTLMRITIGCFVAALLIRLGLPSVMRPVSVYVLMPTRMDALASGAFVALAARGPRGWDIFGWRPWPVLILSGLIIWALVLETRSLVPLNSAVRTIGYSAIALFTASVLVLAVTARDGAPLRKLLEARALIWFGTYSYGLYILHPPILYIMSERGLQASMVPAIGGSWLPGLLVFTIGAGVTNMWISKCYYLLCI